MANPSISQIQIVSNMVQGVSQQAPQNRRDAQCESQFDTTNSVLDGVIPRPHAQLLKMLMGADFEGAFFMETSHGPDENYVIGFKADGTPFGYNLADGTACTINNTAGNVNYITAGAGITSKNKLRGQTVDDFNFIVNREKIPQMAGTTSPAKVNEALIFVRATNFNTTYSVVVSGTGGGTASHVTNGTTVDPTSAIAADLTAQLNALSGYTASRSGSTIRVARLDGAAFGLATSDGNGDDYLYGFMDTIRNSTKIPARGFNGMVFKVKGEDHTSDDDYYIKFVGDPATGYWQETVAPGVQTSLDATTMPVALVCTNLNTFEYRQLTWSTRIAGDDTSAKIPSFVGKKPRGLMYHQGRLGLIWSGGTVFGKTNNPFTWFPDTVQTVLATAPIDTKMAGSSGKGPPTLDFGLEFQENLFAWAQQQQFRISSGQDPFKQDTVEVRNSMAYEYSPLAFPLGVGAFLFLTTDVGQNATLRTLLFQGGKLSGDTDVAAHAPKYIPSGVSVLTGSDTLRHLYLISDSDPTIMTQFCWTYSSDQGFLQTALNKWRIPGGRVLWASLKGNSLRALVQKPEGAALVTFNLSPQIVDSDAGATYLTRMDYRVTEAGVTGLTYNAGTGNTSFTLPYTPTGADVLLATREDKVGGFTRGRAFKVLSVVGAVVTVQGNLTGYKFYVGQRITAERTDSEFFIRTDKGSQPVDNITLNRYKLAMANTQYTRIEVTTGERTWEEVFEGRILGTPSGHTGAPDPVSHDLDIGIRWRSDEVTVRLVNDTFMSSAWQNSSYDFDAVGWKGAK